MGNVEVLDGSVGALIGENGTGKTTVLRMAAGSIWPATGLVQIGRPKIAFTDIERQVHYRLTLVENHQFFRALYGLKAVSRRTTLDSLDLAGLAAMSERKAGALSKGEKSRLLFSIIEAHECASFIVDEPTNGLDEDGKAYIGGVITRKMASGASGLISTHDQDFLRSLGATPHSLDANGVFSADLAGCETQ